MSLSKNYPISEMFLHDCDIIVDCAGAMRRVDLAAYLISQGFRWQGDEETKGVGTILRNTESVGGDCITFIVKHG